MEYFLLSIIPSEDIVLKIMQLRTLLFKEFGLVSSRCLPVMIPIAYIPEYISKEQFKGLTLPEAVCTSVYRTGEGGDIYLQVKNIDFADEIEKRIRGNRSTLETEGFINLQKGFYLATENMEITLKKVLTFIHSETEETLTWKKNSLELIRIETMNDIWWENIRWETIWDIRIGRRETGEGRPEE